jgi:hypothetical protein
MISSWPIVLFLKFHGFRALGEASLIAVNSRATLVFVECT